jgi:4-hydroxy-tetrahydrodipicolinate synthase
LLEFDIRPKLVQYIKLTEERAGVGSEHVRAPRLKLEGKERAEALKIIDAALATRPVLPEYLSL